MLARVSAFADFVMRFVTQGGRSQGSALHPAVYRIGARGDKLFADQPPVRVSHLFSLGAAHTFNSTLREERAFCQEEP